MRHFEIAISVGHNWCLPMSCLRRIRSERDEPLPEPATVVEVELTPPAGIEVVMLVATELTPPPGMPMDT
ncbi:hypothetical protein KCV07_g413, partial [Aureobasidium melanogenum]